MQRAFSSLIVLVHGIDSPLLIKDTLSNLRVALLQQASLRDVFVLQSKVNQGRTKDGIEKMATRLVWEIEDACREHNLLKTGVQISFVGHSLGGIISRYAIFLLHEKKLLGERFVPVSYVAVASPHLGVRRAETWLGRFQSVAGEFLYGGSQTLDELMLRDHPENPLLVRMASNEFLNPLSKFRLTLVSAIAFDHQVGVSFVFHFIL